MDLGSAHFGLWLRFSASSTTRFAKDSNFPYFSSNFFFFLLIFQSLGLWVWGFILLNSMRWTHFFTGLLVIGSCKVLVFVCFALFLMMWVWSDWCVYDWIVHWSKRRGRVLLLDFSWAFDVCFCLTMIFFFFHEF